MRRLSHLYPQALRIGARSVQFGGWTGRVIGQKPVLMRKISTNTKYLKSKTKSPKRVTASHSKTRINCENPFATHRKSNMVERHIPGAGTKWKGKQSEKVTRKARPVEVGTMSYQTKESVQNYLSQRYLESSWNTRCSTSYELRSS